MSYHVGDYIEPTDESSPASVASDAVNSLLTLLKTRIPVAAEPEETEGERFSPVEIYHKSTRWASEHNSQSISLDALRQVLGLSREEALGVEQKVSLFRRVRLEVAVTDADLERAIQAISDGAHEVGGWGSIFVTELHDVISIWTGERGPRILS